MRGWEFMALYFVLACVADGTFRCAHPGKFQMADNFTASLTGGTWKA